MVEISEENGQLIVRIGGQEYARYQFGSPRWKPYLYPLRAANGLSLLADAPTDHRHHHGIWAGHGRVDDADFWLERHNSGKIVQRGIEDLRASGEVASFTTLNDWEAASGDVMLKDTRTFTFFDEPTESRRFDLEIVIASPDQRTVQLHPSNEAGLPHVRVAEGLTVKTGGTLTNAEGKTNERGTYKQRSPWMDCSGKLGRLQCGIAVFDHPANPDFPTHWFTRDYGPFSPNYGFFQEDPIEIGPDSPLRLRYRFYTHSGNVEDGGVEAAWQQYAESTGWKPAISE
ncbi:MAG TPA: PmoA family protein [Chthonomonadaceae bacterium]|nr:PmoA family protein [Chthonomonadaceae bacterium]